MLHAVPEMISSRTFFLFEGLSVNYLELTL